MVDEVCLLLCVRVCLCATEVSLVPLTFSGTSAPPQLTSPFFQSAPGCSPSLHLVFPVPINLLPFHPSSLKQWVHPCSPTENCVGSHCVPPSNTSCEEANSANVMCTLVRFPRLPLHSIPPVPLTPVPLGLKVLAHCCCHSNFQLF